MTDKRQALLLLCITCQSCNDYSASALSMLANNNNAKGPSRRSFMSKAASTAGLIGVTSSSWLTGPEIVHQGGEHSDNCDCPGCNRPFGFLPMNAHSDNCDCAECRNLFGLQPANAIEAVKVKEEAGNTNAIKYAFEKQAEETNARLVKDGFQLDTKEEEEAKIQEGLSSSSYEEMMGMNKKKTGNKGYGKK